MTSNLKGSISQVIGAVVDVTFEENLPAILNALSVQVGQKTKILKVPQHHNKTFAKALF